MYTHICMKMVGEFINSTFTKQQLFSIALTFDIGMINAFVYFVLFFQNIFFIINMLSRLLRNRLTFFFFLNFKQKINSCMTSKSFLSGLFIHYLYVALWLTSVNFICLFNIYIPWCAVVVSFLEFNYFAQKKKLIINWVITSRFAFHYILFYASPFSILTLFCAWRNYIIIECERRRRKKIN